MQIKTSVELEDGSYTYQGTFSGKELDFLVEFAVNNLLMQGALPFVTEDGETYGNIVMPENDTEQ